MNKDLLETIGLGAVLTLVIGVGGRLIYKTGLKDGEILAETRRDIEEAEEFIKKAEELEKEHLEFRKRCDDAEKIFDENKNNFHSNHEKRMQILNDKLNALDFNKDE